MKIAEKVNVRIAETKDLAWCIRKDKLINENVLKRKVKNSLYLYHSSRKNIVEKVLGKIF